MAISVIAIALAAQAAGQEITTFHPLPSQEKQEQAQPQAADRAAEAAPQEAKLAPTAAAAEPETIEVLSVREIPPTANVRYVPPPEGEGEPE